MVCAMLADPEIAKAANIETFDELMRVLGLLAKHYEQARQVAQRLCQLLHEKEHLGI